MDAPVCDIVFINTWAQLLVGVVSCDTLFAHKLIPAAASIESEAKENDTTKSYTKRGENAQTGMHWDAIDNHYVYVKFNKYNVTDTANYIKGVGLYHNTEKKNKPAEVPPAVIASSPGTESFSPYVDQTNYNRYWTGNNYVVKGDGEGDSWFGNNNATHHIWRLYPAYTTKNLSRPIEVKKPIPY